VHVDDVGADGHVHGRGKAEAPRRRQQADRQVLGPLLHQVASHGGAEAETVGIAGHDRVVDLLARLARHAEGAGPEPRGDVLGGLARPRELEVVHDARAVEGEARDQPALHQVDDHRGEPDLDDVRAQPPQDRPLALARAQDVVHEGAEAQTPQDAREPFQETRQGRASDVGSREVGEGDLAAAAAQRIRAHAREVQRPRRRARGAPRLGRTPARHQPAIASSTIAQRTWMTRP
jgi:hypothetical protein